MTTASPGTQRSWFRFSLKTLLVAVAILPICLGFYVKSIRDRNTAKAAVAAVKRVEAGMDLRERFDGGWKLIRVYPDDYPSDETIFDNTSSILFPGGGLRPNGYHRLTSNELRDVVPHLTKFPQLKGIHLHEALIDDKDLAHLIPLSDNLHHVILVDCRSISDAGLQHFRIFKKLSQLTIKGSAVTPDGIAELKKALPNCTIDFTPYGN